MLSESYTFQHFVHLGPGDLNPIGTTVTWSFSSGDPRSITKRSRKWMHYERRPRRPVAYLGPSRVAPAIEQRSLRLQFAEQNVFTTTPLSEKARSHLGQVMGHAYGAAETLETVSRYRLRRCTASSTYSSFNMGAGEDVVIELLATLYSVPEGSLVVIEEVELGLHPAAVRRLATALLEVAEARHLQIVCSSHSKEFIDALPRKARMLLERHGDTVDCIDGPTTNLAFGVVSDVFDTELHIYCEDEFAAAVILHALDSRQRMQCRIIPTGGKDQLVSAARFHLLSQDSARVALAWDGDVRETEVQSYVSKLPAAQRAGVATLTLPGGDVPERYVLNAIRESPKAVSALSLGINDTEAFVTALLDELIALQDPHDLCYEAARKTGLDTSDVLTILMQALRTADSEGMGDLSRTIGALLDSGH